VTKKELIDVLRNLLQGLVDAETPKPPPPPGPTPPAEGHQPHLRAGKFGCEFCCDAHEAQFDQQARPYQRDYRDDPSWSRQKANYLARRFGPRR
jgi:hypothetical protein